MAGFENIIGYEEAVNELKRVCMTLKDPERYQKLGVKTPQNLLICGGKCTGKTLLAKCFIEESGRWSQTLHKEEYSKDFYVNIESTFHQFMSYFPAIYFLDDMDEYSDEICDDSIATNLKIVKVLTESRNRKVFVIATVKDKEKLHPAIVGMFDKCIDLKYQEFDEAEQIIKHMMEKYKVADDVNLLELRILLGNKSYSVFNDVMNEAGMLAASEGMNEIGRYDVRRAAFKVCYGFSEKKFESFADILTRDDIITKEELINITQSKYR